MSTPFTSLAKQLTASLKQRQHILIVIKGSPDPDGIASSFALKVLCDTLDIAASIIATTEVSLEQNRQLITDLAIPITFLDAPPDIRPYDAYMVADHQSAQVEFIKNKIPSCAAHIDHHVPVQEDIQIDVNITLEAAGATSTMLGLILKELSLALDAELFKRIATALVWGIKTDTDGFAKAQPLDYDALTYLFPYADRVIISRLMGTAVSDQPIGLIAKAIKNKVLYKDWLIAGIGFIEASKRDAIALIADFLLKKENPAPDPAPPPYIVEQILPNEALVMGHQENGEWVDLWQFILVPQDDNSTRLILRTRTMMVGGFWDIIHPGVFTWSADCGLASRIAPKT